MKMIKAFYQKSSIRVKVQVLLVLVQIPFLLLIFLYFMLGLITYKNNLKSSSLHMLDYCSKTVNTSVTSIDNSLQHISVSNPDFSQLTVASSQLEAHLASYTLLEEFRDFIYANEELDACYIINDKFHLFRAVYDRDEPSYESKMEMESFVREKTDGNPAFYNAVLYPKVIGDNCYYFVIRGQKGNYVAAAINYSDYHFPEISDYPNFEQGIIMYRDDGLLMGNQEIYQKMIQSSQDGGTLEFQTENGSYIAALSQLERGSLRMAYVIKDGGYFSNMAFVTQRAYIFMILIMIILIPIEYMLLRKIFVRPLDTLVQVMDDIRYGKYELDKIDVNDIDARTKGIESEFREITETFKEMMKRVSELKIESYEKSMQLRKTELDYYHIQIRPHFYTNCLKSIYGLLEEGNIEDAQKMVVDLSKHLRYMMQSHDKLVTCGQELEYIRNYIDLQQISMAFPPELAIEADTEILEKKIPPISLLTLVENSIRYANTGNRQSEIHVRCRMMESDGEWLMYFSVSDNGVGFSAEKLRELNAETDAFEEKTDFVQSLGIRNVMKRFQLIYGEENAQFAFSNLNGANVDIFVKISKCEENPKKVTMIPGER